MGRFHTTRWRNSSARTCTKRPRITRIQRIFFSTTIFRSSECSAKLAWELPSHDENGQSQLHELGAPRILGCSFLIRCRLHPTGLLTMQPWLARDRPPSLWFLNGLATLEVKSPRYYNFSCAEIEIVTKSITFYVIFTVRYAVIEDFCVILQRSSEHDLLKQRSVMLDLLIETWETSKECKDGVNGSRV